MKLANIYILIFIALILTCCITENPVNPDPCAGKKPFKADFTIFEAVEDSLFIADTVLYGNAIKFMANSDYDTYKWTVGDQKLEYFTKSFALKFNEPYPEIVVRLIATKKPDTLCFPNDDGIDTVMKKITILKYEGESALVGEWIGSTDKNPLDSFIVSIFYKNVYNNNGEYFGSFYFINNLNKGCNSIWRYEDGRESPQIRYSPGYRTARFHARGFKDNGCNSPYGYIKLSWNHTEITIEYDQLYNFIGHYVFKGRRIKRE